MLLLRPGASAAAGARHAPLPGVRRRCRSRRWSALGESAAPASAIAVAEPPPPLPRPAPAPGGPLFGVSAQQLAQLMQAALEQQEDAGYSAPAALATLPALAAALGLTSLASGPAGTPADLAARRAAFGRNFVPPPPLEPFWALLLDALRDPTLLLLTGAGALSLALSLAGGGGGGGGAAKIASSGGGSADWIDGAAILCSVAVCSLVAAGTNYDKQSKFRALAAARDVGASARVVRGGRERAARAEDLVVGDVLLLEAGDILPADALLLPVQEALGAPPPRSSSSSPQQQQQQEQQQQEEQQQQKQQRRRQPPFSPPPMPPPPPPPLLRVDESHLTGESEEVGKSALGDGGGGASSSSPLAPAAAARSALYGGSKVLEGYGRALVVAVGPNSQQGLISALVARAASAADAITSGVAAAADGAAAAEAPPPPQKPPRQQQGDGAAPSSAAAAAAAAATTTTATAAPPPDPDRLLRERTRLAAQLEDVSGAVGRAGAAAAAAVLAANVALYAASVLPPGPALLSSPDPPAWLALWAAALASPQALREYLRFFTASVAVLVVAVPEGLPLAVTLALAFGVSKMLEERNLVRRLDACEAMALCTSVCSDKTGTLTENEMRVVRVVAGGRAFAVRPSLGAGAARDGEEADEEAAALDVGSLLAEDEILPRVPRRPRREQGQEGMPADVVTMVSLSLDSRDEQALSGAGAEGAGAGAAAGADGRGAGAAAAPAAVAAVAIARAAEPVALRSSASSMSAERRFSPSPLSSGVLRDLSVACIALTSTASVRRRATAAPAPVGASASAAAGSSSAAAAASAAAVAAAAALPREPGRDGRGALQLDRAGNRTECALLEFAGRLGGRLVDASPSPPPSSGDGGAGDEGGGGGGSDGGGGGGSDSGGDGGNGVGPGAEALLDGRRLEVARRLTFSSERKRSSAILQAAPLGGGGDGSEKSRSNGDSSSSSIGRSPDASWLVPSAAVPPGAARVYVKGAADVVLERCTHVLLPAPYENGNGNGSGDGNGNGSGDGNGNGNGNRNGNGIGSSRAPGGTVAVPLTARDRSALLRLALGDGDGGDNDGREAGSALRLLALAYRDAPAAVAAAAAADDAPNGGGQRGNGVGAARDDDAAERGLTLVALAGLEDPVRPEAEGAVRDCARAGIRVRMLTGDSPATAAAIAQQCGILPPGRAHRRALLAARERRRARVLAARAAGDARAALPPAWNSSAADVAARAVDDDAEREGGADGWALMDGAELRALILKGRGSGGGGGGAGEPPLPSAGGGAPDVDLDALARLWPRLRVVARCTPADKHALVSGYRALRRRGAAAAAAGEGAAGEGAAAAPGARVPQQLRLPPGDDGAIAVTGDGTNDAPALAAADVGFAMASGTAVARDAADILLLDDNFASVVTSVRWGRNVHLSVSRFLTFQLSASAVAVCASAAGSLLLRGETVLAPVQLLWVNLIVDSLASLALATEPPSPGVLDERPRRAGAPAVTPRMAAVIGAQAAFQLLALALVLSPPVADGIGGGGGTALEFVLGEGGRAEQLTLAFNCFVAMSLGSQVAVRAIGGGGGGGDREGAAAAAAAAAASPPPAGGATTPFASPAGSPTPSSRPAHFHTSLLRPLQGLDRAPLFVGILALEACLQACIVQAGGRAFSTVPLNGGEWALSVALGACACAVGACAAAAPGVPDEWPAAAAPARVEGGEEG